MMLAERVVIRTPDQAGEAEGLELGALEAARYARESGAARTVMHA